MPHLIDGARHFDGLKYYWCIKGISGSLLLKRIRIEHRRNERKREEEEEGADQQDKEKGNQRKPKMPARQYRETARRERIRRAYPGGGTFNPAAWWIPLLQRHGRLERRIAEGVLEIEIDGARIQQLASSYQLRNDLRQLVTQPFFGAYRAERPQWHVWLRGQLPLRPE